MARRTPVAAYERALARDAADVAAYKYLGELLLTSGRIRMAARDSIASRRAWLRSCSPSGIEVLQHRGDFAALDRYLEGLARQIRPRPLELVDNPGSSSISSFLRRRAAPVFRYAQTHDARRSVYGRPFERQRSPARPYSGRVSVTDLRNHAMGKMTWGALGRHDRSASRRFGSLSREREEWTDLFAGIAESFVPLADAGGAKPRCGSPA
jgi:hypothetical protein